MNEVVICIGSKSNKTNGVRSKISPFKWQICTACIAKVNATYIFGEDEVRFEVSVSILTLWNSVSEGSVGLVPVDTHVTGRIVDEVVDIISQLSCARSSSFKSWDFKNGSSHWFNLHWDSSTLFLLNFAHDWGTLPLTSSSSMPSWCLMSMASLCSSWQSLSISRAMSLCSRSACSLS